jgi:hypothetical protein
MIKPKLYLMPILVVIFILYLVAKSNGSTYIKLNVKYSG